MDVFHSITKQEIRTALAIGCFDGVHIGHRAVLDAAKSYAEKHGAAFSVLVIDFPGCRPKEKGKGNLFSASERERLLRELGVEKLFIIPFEELKELTGERFADGVLSKEKLNAAAVFVGKDFRFGKDRSCGIPELKNLCEARDVELFALDEVLYGGKAVSTTRIKAAVESGDMESASAMLGRAI